MTAGALSMPVAGAPELRHLEVAKSLGLVAMLVDHVAWYAFGVDDPIAQAIGSLAFPLFAFAFGFGVARLPGKALGRVVLRLAGWAGIAQLAVLLVREGSPWTVLATFVCGTIIYGAVMHIPRALSWLVVIGAALVATQAEYGIAGAAFVAAVLFYVRFRTPAAIAAVLALLVSLTPYNGTAFGLASVAVVYLINELPRDLPRLRGVFGPIYSAQFPLLRLLREVAG